MKFVEPFHLNVSTSDIVVLAGSENSSATAIISIDYDASPPPRFIWNEHFSFDSESNDTYKNYEANYSRNNFVLKISSLTTRHCRNHTMSVSNLAGKQDVSAELIVTGK